MLKKYELEVEAKDFYGCQTFACEAESELEARDMFRRGMCEIIDVQIEVLGLEHEPMNIIESDDISSRLPQDLMARITEENKRLREALVALVETSDSNERQLSQELLEFHCDSKALTNGKQLLSELEGKQHV